ncbi:MAG: hypothetical protein IPG82_05600 [Saprospiraceae bacterium]|jgi:hypothetical protein|nr:hypothetical protein [Saprospiraceae bacterium]MBK7606225.1 hypothetical protein [Saprospiraceae bacterium]MBK9678004.1 hypothetical protein [Saprospiraceae bacterium]MBP8941836.1 hypothetical protein [Saprospiraceae bacterium]
MKIFLLTLASSLLIALMMSFRLGRPWPVLDNYKDMKNREDGDTDSLAQSQSCRGFNRLLFKLFAGNYSNTITN